MKKDKLTDREMEVLTLLVNGAGPLHRCTHTNINTPDSHFLSRGMEKVRAPSVRKLERLGFIEDKEDPGWRWRGSRFEITTKGRDIVAAR